jgi:hypothetical protein
VEPEQRWVRTPKKTSATRRPPFPGLAWASVVRLQDGGIMSKSKKAPKQDEPSSAPAVDPVETMSSPRIEGHVQGFDVDLARLLPHDKKTAPDVSKK